MSTLAFFSSSYITLSAGKFDTRKRYIRKSASGVFPIVKDRTFVVTVTTTSGVNAGLLSWRFSVGTYAAAYTDSGSPISYDPAYALVTL